MSVDISKYDLFKNDILAISQVVTIRLNLNFENLSQNNTKLVP